MITSEHEPQWRRALRTKDFISKERIKKHSAKDFLNSRVNVFFEEKLKDVNDLKMNLKFKRILERIAATNAALEQKKEPPSNEIGNRKV